VLVFVCLRIGCSHMTEVGGPYGLRLALKIVMQSDWGCGGNLFIVHVVVFLCLDLK
jgi:hypothetical protein